MNCLTCKYFVPELRGLDYPVEGQCRRFPPSVYIGGFKGSVKSSGGIFPHVTFDEWCGEFIQKAD